MKKVKVKGEGEERKAKKPKMTLNDPARLLIRLCHARCSIWEIYDKLSITRSSESLILTRSEKERLMDVTSMLVDVYVKLDDLMTRRMQSVGLMKEGGAK